MANPDDPQGFTRRQMLAATTALWLSPRPSFAIGDDDDREIAEIRKMAQDAGLPALRVEMNDDYLAIGNSPDAFRKQALRLCLGLARDYLKHFADKGFAVTKPKDRMTLVVLANRQDFGAFLGEDLGPEVAGIYEPGTNRLILFDNRAGVANPKAGRANTFVLFHEATHQLTFNTGLLTRGGDVPLAIAEGLGMYGEVRSVDGRTKIGAMNRERMDGIIPRNARRFKPMLTPIATLITDDLAIESGDNRQNAYAQSWLLTHFLMNATTRRPEFRAYLDAIRTRKNADARVDDWTKAFGDPAKMDLELQTYASKLK